MQASAGRRVSLPIWINARSVLGLILFATSLIAGRAVMTSNDRLITVLVAERPLASGHRRTPNDLSSIAVHLPNEQVLRYVSQPSDVAGLVLDRPLAAGELIPADAVVPAADPQRVVSIPIEPEHAAGGRLTPGDIVDIWATFDRGGDPVTRLVVGSVEVVGLVSEGGLVGEEALSGVSIAIPPEAAPRVVLALRAGQIDILTSDGSASSVMTQTLTVNQL